MSWTIVNDYGRLHLRAVIETRQEADQLLEKLNLQFDELFPKGENDAGTIQPVRDSAGASRTAKPGDD